MRNLTASLLAAQKKSRGKPYFRLYVSDRLGAQYRHHWVQLYSDEVDDYPHAMVIAGDGSIVRVLSDNGTAKYQRVTDPEDSEQWESWTGGMGSCSTGYQMALCASGAYVWWFYIDSSATVLYCRESNDYGASWGSAVTVLSCGGTKYLESVAAAVISGTDLIVFYSRCDSATAPSAHVLRRKRIGGSWGGASSWGKDAHYQIKGLSCWNGEDYNMLYGGRVDGSVYGFEAGTTLWGVWSIVYGKGGQVTADTWSDPVEVDRGDAGTSWAAAWPSLVDADVYRAVFTGYLIGEEYSRVMQMRGYYGLTFQDHKWTDPAPFQAEGGPYGMDLAYVMGGDGYIYAACSNAAYRAAVGGLGSCELGARVKKYRLVDRWAGHKAAGVAVDYGQLVSPESEAEIWLENDDGELSSLGSGDYAMVLRGSRVQFGRGYHTSEGEKVGHWPDVWIEDIEHVVDFQGRRYVVLHCVSAWGLMSAMSAQRQYHWLEGETSVWNIVERLVGLAGFRLTSQGEESSLLSSLKPPYIVHPGQDLRGAVLGALSKVPDFIFFDAGTAYVKELASDEASDYSYGGSGQHVILAGRYGQRTAAYNHIEVFAGVTEVGIPIFGDEVDYEEIALVGHRLQKVYDYAYADSGECDDRAVSQLRKHNATGKRGEIVTLPNVGLELFDVVTITDSRAGMSGEKYRVRGIEEVFDSTKHPVVYQQTVELGAP
jgi:hypothetical protein